MEGISVAFLIADDVISSDAVYEDVNTLLNGGVLSTLYTSDEMAAIVGELTPRANSVGAFTVPEIQLYFTTQCQRNLHIVLALSPLAPNFRYFVVHVPMVPLT